MKGMNLDHEFYVMLIKRVVQKMRRWVTNTIYLYKLTIFFTILKQINNKRTLVNLYKIIVLVTLLDTEN